MTTFTLMENNSTSEPRILRIPKSVKMNLEKFDLVLESVWKIMLFAHYYCSEFFSHPADLSLLHSRWQSLLAPDLMQRWQVYCLS